MKKFIYSILIIASCSSYSQNSFQKDLTFNPFAVPTNNYFVDGSVSNSYVQADGKILIVESTTSFNSPSNISPSKLVRLDNNNLDTTFNTGSGFNGLIKDVAIQSDGKIIVVGSFSAYNGVNSRLIVRLNIDGSLDTSFNTGTGLRYYVNSNYPYASAVEVLNDGKILVGGSLMSYNGQYKNSLFKLNIDGTLDTTFTLDSSLGQFELSQLAVQNDGKILIANEYLCNIKRINADGSIDSSFYNNVDFTGTGIYSYIHTIVLQPDGKILVGGKFFYCNTVFTKDIARLNADGTIDMSFLCINMPDYSNASDEVVRYGVSALLLESDGKIIVGGDFRKYNNIAAKGIMRLNPDLTRDFTFDSGINIFDDNPTSTIRYGCVNDLDRHTDGTILCSGYFFDYKNIPVHNIVKLLSNGNKDSSFTNICRGFDGDANIIRFQNDGKIIIAGHFHSYDGINRNKILRLNQDGSLDTSFNVNTSAFIDEVNSPLDVKIQNDGKIIVGSLTKYYNGYPGGALVRLNSDGSIDTSFNSLILPNYGYYGNCSSLAIQPDGKILAGGLLYLNSATVKQIIRLNSDATEDSSFQFTNPLTSVRKIALQPDGKIIVLGDLDSSRRKIIRVLANGDIDSSFDLAPSLLFYNNYLTFDLLPDGKILITSDSSSLQKHAIYRINSDGSIDTSFNFTTINYYFNSKENANLVLPDGKILIAVGNNYNSKGIIKLNSNGSIDTTFDVNPGFALSYFYLNNLITDKITQIVQQQDGKILLAGKFRFFNNEIERSILRLYDTSLSNTNFTFDDTLVLYPNPAKNYLNFQKVDQSSNYRIFSNLGQLIDSGKIENDTISIMTIPNGIYFIELFSNNKKIIKRFIKQ